MLPAKRHIASLLALALSFLLSWSTGLWILGSAATCYVITPILISLCERFNAKAEVNERSNHTKPIPTCGGVAFFLVLLSTFAFTLYEKFDPSHSALALSVLGVFILGMIDDLRHIKAVPKFIFQVSIALFAVTYADIRIESLYGLFGIHHIDQTEGLMLTTLVIVGIMNAYNLVDGIDGLAGSIGFVNLFVLGYLLLWSNSSYHYFCFALCGSLLGFLNYNLEPARVFMGDVGSLLIGFLTSICAVKLLSLYPANYEFDTLRPLPIVIGLFLLPVYDTLRLFALRILNKRSPFSADRNHLHHYMMDYGHSVETSNRILIGIHLVIILASGVLSNTGLSLHLICLMQVLMVNVPFVILVIVNKTYGKIFQLK